MRKLFIALTLLFCLLALLVGQEDEQKRINLKREFEDPELLKNIPPGCHADTKINPDMHVDTSSFGLKQMIKVVIRNEDMMPFDAFVDYAIAEWTEQGPDKQLGYEEAIVQWIISNDIYEIVEVRVWFSKKNF